MFEGSIRFVFPRRPRVRPGVVPERRQVRAKPDGPVSGKPNMRAYADGSFAEAVRYYSRFVYRTGHVAPNL